MNWDIMVPIIVAIVSSLISYLASRNNNKTELEKARLLIESELAGERERHKQEIEKLEKQMEMQSKSKETDAITDLTSIAFQDLMGKDFMQEKLQEEIHKAFKDK